MAAAVALPPRPSTGGRRFVRPAIEQKVPVPDARPGTSAGERRSIGHAACPARILRHGSEETLEVVQSDKKRSTHSGERMLKDSQKAKARATTLPTSQVEETPELVRSDRKRSTHSGTSMLKEPRDASKSRGTPRGGSKESVPDGPSLPEIPRSSSSRARERSDSKMSSASTGGSFTVREEDPGRFQRRLSFIDCSIDDLDQHFQTEFTGADWFKNFWYTVLTQQPLCRTLCSRSLSSWVAVYNSWQAAGKWNGPPEYMNTQELQEWLVAPLSRVLELVKLFDPPGYAKVNMTKATQDYIKVKVPITPLMAACLIMSQALSTRQKFQFICGMFDLEDNDALSITEFTAMWVSLVRGLACAFGVKEPPAPRAVAMVARKAFEELGLGVADRLPKKTLEDFLFGKIPHPLGLPFGLMMRRFSVDCGLVDPESYIHESKRFRLSHKKPIENPLEAYTLQDAAYLTRIEVVVARDVFQYCLSRGDYSLSYADAERAIGKPISVEIWCTRMSRALEEARGLQDSGVSFDMSMFLKKLCPRATTVHLQMFQSWLQDFDNLQKQKIVLERSKSMLAELRKYNALPVMTERVRQELMTGFHLVDRMDAGRVSTLDLQACMEVEKATAKNMMRYFDTNSDGFVDMEEYIAAMCPGGHRLPSKVQDRIFDLILSAEVERQEELVAQQDALFSKMPGERKALTTPCLKARAFLPKQVPDLVWEDWNAAWQALDSHRLGYLTRGHLRQARAMRMDVSDFMFDLIATSEAESFSKEQFLAKLLDSAGFRPREFSGSQ